MEPKKYLTVTFTPWYSKYQAENFVAISVTRCGRQVYRACMTLQSAGIILTALAVLITNLTIARR